MENVSKSIILYVFMEQVLKSIDLPLQFFSPTYSFENNISLMYFVAFHNILILEFKKFAHIVWDGLVTVLLFFIFLSKIRFRKHKNSEEIYFL
jgi:hypothetical protein